MDEPQARPASVAEPAASAENPTASAEESAADTRDGASGKSAPAPGSGLAASRAPGPPATHVPASRPPTSPASARRMRRADSIGRLLPDRAAEDEPGAWGDPRDDSDARLLDDVPPHHGS